MKLLLVVLFGSMCMAQEMSKPVLVFNASRTTVIASAVADCASSWHAYEMNPLLGKGTFGMRQASISMGITVAAMWVEGPVVKRWPAARKPLMIANYVMAGVRLGAVVHNVRVQ